MVVGPESSEDRRDKVGFVKESCRTNDGRRSVIQGSFGPGAMAPTHYHTEFDESFEILEGELSVWNTGKKMTLTSGDKATIRRGAHHSFKNESGKTVRALVILEPGYYPFEQNIQIMMGLQRDGLVDQLSRVTPAMIPLGMVLGELSNTKLTGPLGLILRVASLFFNKQKIERRKKELLDTYCS